jgi:hypothetical protein
MSEVALYAPVAGNDAELTGLHVMLGIPWMNVPQGTGVPRS